MAFAVPRLKTAPVRGGRMPYVEHPMSRLGDRAELTVTGTNTPVLRRENTYAGHSGLRLDNTALKRVVELDTGLSDMPSPRILQWPPEYLQKPSRPGTVRFQQPASKFVSDFELLENIQQKLTSGYYGVKHMFKANDPSGHGNVSRDALLRILYNLVGYITKEQFEKLLRILELDRHHLISFDQFMACFKDNETVSKEWISPIQRFSSLVPEPPPHREDRLRRTDVTHWDPNSTPAYASAILREKLANGNVDIHNILPLACFEPGGYIVAPQLREALAHIGVRLTDADFLKFWSRYDRENVGALQTSQFFRDVDLDTMGQPKNQIETSSHPQQSVKQTRTEVVTSTEQRDWVDKVVTEERNRYNLHRSKTMVVKSGNSQKVTRSVRTEEREEAIHNLQMDPRIKAMKHKSRVPPRFDNVTDSLHHKIAWYLHEFEEAYSALLAGFKLFDFMDDGYVSRLDFRRVLQEFGFNIQAVELEHFLARAGLRSIQGQVNYRDFLAKYQSISPDSITSQVLTSRSHSFQRDTYNTVDMLSAQELEARVIEYLHRDFMKLLARFRTSDPQNLGTVTQHDFRRVIESQLGFAMTDVQWMQLKMSLGLDPNGLVPYNSFLQLFDTEPGSWNHRKEGGLVVTRFNNVYPPPPQVEQLRERAKSFTRQDEKPTYPGMRSVPELQKLLGDFFRGRFHSFDKQFKEMDRKMLGRMSKWQFGAIMKLCGVTLSTSELDRLWMTLGTDSDGMLAYSSLVKHFSPGHKVPEPPAFKKSIVFEDSSPLVETARRVQQERREREKQVELERQARRADMERRDHERKAQLQLAARQAYGQQEDEKQMLTAARDAAREVEKRAEDKLMELQQQKVNRLLSKVKKQVMSQRDYLKTYFQTRDRMGFAHIAMTEMKGVMDRLYFGLTEDEKVLLCQHFDLNNNGRFHYLAFMDAFKSISDASSSSTNHQAAYSTGSHQLQRKSFIC